MDNVILLESLKAQIEKLEKEQQIEILKILHNNQDVKLNENKSGVFINLSFLPEQAIKDVKKHLDYIKDQEQTLKLMESKKEKFAKTYFEHGSSA
jgi:hypothetical protein